MAYAHRQVENVFPYMDGVRQFLLAGPADGDEAQILHAKYPDVKIWGFEPNVRWLRHQLEIGFPGTLLNYALWHTPGILELQINPGENGDRSASVCRQRSGSIQRVEARTLDDLSAEYGPFEDALLWLDIEGAELGALRGAANLLSRVLVLNVEIFADETGPGALLRAHGFSEVKRWGEHRQHGRHWWNAVYRRMPNVSL